MRQIGILPQLSLELTYRQLPGVSRNSGKRKSQREAYSELY